MIIKKKDATTVAKINGIEIEIVKGEDGKEYIPIKPICEILGIDSNGQNQKIEKHPILNSVTCIIHATGSDKKEYEMKAIEFEFVFGWLFTIQPDRVREGAREAVIAYQRECYHALYVHFTSFAKYNEFKTNLVDEKLTLRDAVKLNFTTAKDKLKEIEEQLKEARQLTFDEYNERQTTIDFPDLNQEG